jgi:hypothetical protein
MILAVGVGRSFLTNKRAGEVLINVGETFWLIF